jgi:uncharacterized membrane protein
MSNDQSKKPWQSGGIVTAFIMLLFGILEFFGYAVDPELQAIIQDEDTIERIIQSEQAKGLLVIALSIAFAYFRIRARRAIEGGADVLASPFRKIGQLFKRNKAN